MIGSTSSGVTEYRTISPTGVPPPRRIATASDAHSLFRKFVEADNDSSYNRAAWRAMMDGEPPYDSSMLAESGQEDRCNLNFGDAEAAREQALAGYYDLVSSVPALVEFYTNYGDYDQREEYNRIIAEEITRLLKDWNRFNFLYQLLADYFIVDGIGVVCFPDELDWRFSVDGLANFKIPRKTKATEEALDTAFLIRKIPVNELYSYIEDERRATEAGWNVKAVRKKLLECDYEGGRRFDTWEELREEVKNNDICWGYAKAPEVTLIHGLSKEFSGKITHFIMDDDETGDSCDGGSDGFLFYKNARFSSIGQATCVFTYGIGNGTYHSIRGLGYKIFSRIQVINRLSCSLVDGGMMSTATTIQPVEGSSRALDDMSITYVGPYAVLPPGMKVVEKSAVSNFSQNAIPVLNLLTQGLQNNTSTYQSRAVTPEGQARTAFEIRAQLQKDAVLASSAVDLFYGHWKRLIKEVVRRICRRDYSRRDPGGDAILEMRKRLRRRGVPLEALYQMDRVEPMRAVGYGSPQMRLLALDEAMQLASSMDEAGRQNLIRDRIAARFGYELVNRYMPVRGHQRPVFDEGFALLENNQMQLAQSLPVLEGQNHFIHAKVHLGLAQKIMTGLQQAQIELPVAFQVLSVVMPHIEDHLARVKVDLARKDELALMRQMVQQFGASTQRLGDSLQAQTENEAAAQEAEQQRQLEAEQARVRALEKQAALDPKLQQELQERQVRLQMDVQEFQDRRQMKLSEAAQNMAIRDAQSMNKILTLK